MIRVVNQLCWGLARVISHALDPVERDAVRGDLAECDDTGMRALAGISGLVLRRQLELWKDWRSWVALIGVGGLTGLLLSRVLWDFHVTFFQYSIEVANDGNKPIRAILWDYIITDSSNNEELGRHNFVSFEKIGRNSVKGLHVRSRVSPSRVVTVQNSPPPGNSTVVERVVFRCVVYDDGTLWQQPGTNENCEALQKRATK